MAKLRLAEAAKTDIRDIRIFSKAAFGARTARDYLSGMNALFEQLRRTPMIGALQPDLGDGIRRFSYRSHRVYYRVTPALIVIARILHLAQDVTRAFGNEL